MLFIRKKNKKTAFTLIELLVVTTILSIVALAVFQTFTNGLRLYRRLAGEIPGLELEFFFERMNQELHNAFFYHGNNFTGTETELSFVSLIYSPLKKSRLPGCVRYAWDSATQKLIRYENDFFAIMQNSELRRRQELSWVVTAKFSFFVYDQQSQQYVWQQEWNSNTTLPRAVRLELKYGANGMSVNRTWEIPRGLNDTVNKTM